jgi:hypothetical protein
MEFDGNAFNTFGMANMEGKYKRLRFDDVLKF